MKKIKYYSAYDLQTGDYFHSGRNSLTKGECENDICEYLKENELIIAPRKEILKIFEVVIHQHNELIEERDK